MRLNSTISNDPVDELCQIRDELRVVWLALGNDTDGDGYLIEVREHVNGIANRVRDIVDHMSMPKESGRCKMSSETPIAPTAEEWRAAFFDAEDRISHLESKIKIAEFLAGYLADEVSGVVAKKLHLPSLAEATARAVFHIADAMKDTEAAYYANFNDLVARDNAALKGGAK